MRLNVLDTTKYQIIIIYKQLQSDRFQAYFFSNLPLKKGLDLEKVSKFQNGFMKSWFLPKYEL